MSIQFANPALRWKPSTGRLSGLPSPVRVVHPVCAMLFLFATALPGQDYSIDFHTIDGGGEILMETADGQLQLSGTLGQWDGTELIEQSGGGYTLTGGFWPVNIGRTDLLFRDDFEG